MKNFIFVGDLIKRTGNKPITIIKGYTLKKANSVQIQIIKSQIDSYHKINFFPVNRYEVLLKRNNDGSITSTPAKNKYWNYWIIEHSENAMWKNNLSIAFSLSKLDLTLLFQLSKRLNSSNRQITKSNYLTIYHFFHDSSLFTLSEKEITIEKIKEVKIIYYLLLKFIKRENADYDFINKAYEDFVGLNNISKTLPFRIVVYFSIIENLITNSNSNSDRITNQLQNKINLLNNQFSEKVNYQLFFKGAESIGVVIRKLYEYRSDIAHGNVPDFDSKLKLIKTKDPNYTIENFLRMLTQKLIIHALENPQFIKDLRNV